MVYALELRVIDTLSLSTSSHIKWHSKVTLSAGAAHTTLAIHINVHVNY